MADAATNSSTFKAILQEQAEGTIVLSVPHTSYQLHLAVEKPVEQQIGKAVTGQICANAKRVDVVTTGGRYIEPVYGRPRRLQGRIIDADPEANALTVFCGAPFICQLMASQWASEFEVGQLVSFDVERGATFKPAGLEPAE